MKLPSESLGASRTLNLSHLLHVSTWQLRLRADSTVGTATQTGTHSRDVCALSDRDFLRFPQRVFLKVTSAGSTGAVLSGSVLFWGSPTLTGKRYYGGKRQRKAENERGQTELDTSTVPSHGHRVCDRESGAKRHAQGDTEGPALVCLAPGAWHVPVRTSQALARHSAQARAPAPVTVPPGIRTSCRLRLPGPDLLIPARPYRMQTLALGDIILVPPSLNSTCASEEGGGGSEVGDPSLSCSEPRCSFPRSSNPPSPSPSPGLGSQSSPRHPVPRRPPPVLEIGAGCLL